MFFNSNSDVYYFVHIPKTAGISFHNTVLDYNMDNKKLNLLIEQYMQKFDCKYQHAPFSFIKYHFLKNHKIDREIKFITVIRNPWQRMVSLFEQIVLRHKVGLNRKSKNREIRNTFYRNYENVTNNLLNDLGLFENDKIKKLFKFWLFYIGYDLKILPSFNPNLNILSQSWWLLNEETNEEVNEIYLFEDLQSLEKKYNFQLHHDNKKKFYIDYKEYYDEETIEYVLNLDKYVINKFGYDFV